MYVCMCVWVRGQILVGWEEGCSASSSHCMDAWLLSAAEFELGFELSVSESTALLMLAGESSELPLVPLTAAADDEVPLVVDAEAAAVLECWPLRTAAAVVAVV